MTDRLLMHVATLGFIGNLPAPGSMGALVALVFGVGIAIYGGLGMLVVAIIIATLIGFPACDAHRRITGEDDGQAVVIDEVVGQWLVLLAIPYRPEFSLSYMMAAAGAFLLFRFFDISKIGPVKIAEDLPNAAGVMADDVMAGVLAGGVIIFASLIIDYLYLVQ